MASSACQCFMGCWVPRSSSALHTLSSSSEGQFRTVRIKIKMSNPFFFVMLVKCFAPLRPTYLSSLPSIANSSTPSPRFSHTFMINQFRLPEMLDLHPFRPRLSCVFPHPSGFPPSIAGYSPSVAWEAAGSSSLLHLGQDFIFEKL